MKLVVGLGNPGSSYARTRHNVGFWIADRFASRVGLGFSGRSYGAEVARGRVRDEDCVVLKPQTYMNRSGAAVAAAVEDLGVGVEDVLVAYDDLDLAVGRLRLRQAGGAGGHRGLESITDALGTKGFPRVRLGIGRPAGGDVVAYVLAPPEAEEEASLRQAVDTAAEAVECWIVEGTSSAMNRYNLPASRASETGRG